MFLVKGNARVGVGGKRCLFGVSLRLDDAGCGWDGRGRRFAVGEGFVRMCVWVERERERKKGIDNA